MKKYRLLRQGKRVFAAVLAASLMVTSVTPGAVYASETEMTETVVQTEEATEEPETEPNTAAENDEMEVDSQSENEQENSEKMEVQEDTESEVAVQATNGAPEVSDVNDSDVSMFDDDLNASPVAEADNDSETQPFDITVSMVTQLRYGYTSTKQSQIYVSNGTGKIDSNRRCWLEGEDKDAFECYPATSTNSIWYIKPKVGLTAKTYTATLHASYLGEEATKEISLTVLPRTVYVKWGDHEFTYDKKEHVPEVTVNGSGSILEGDTCNLIVKGSQTNAGTYAATVETDNPCYKIYSSQETQSFTINPRPVEFEWDYEDGHVFEYDGNPHTLTATVTGVLEGDTCNPVYQEMTLDTSIPGTTGPKHCTVTITGVDNPNYTTKHGQQLYVSRAFNVVAKKITKIILNPKKAKQYDGTTTFPTSSSYYDYAEDAFTSEIDGLVGDDKVYVSAIQAQSATLDNKDVGTDKALTLNVYLAGKDKYKYDFTGIQVAGTTIVQATGTAAVDPRPVTLQWDKDEFQYDGKEHTPEATIKNGVLSGETCNVNSITVSGENLTEGKAVNAGTYTATATLDNSNYITKVADKEFIIEKADSATVKIPEAKNLTYSGEAQELVTVGEAQGGKIQYRLGTNGDWSDSIPKAVNAGTYKVFYKVIGDSNHQDTDEGKIEVTIKKADPALSVSAVADKNYGEEAFKLESSNKGDRQKSYASNDEKVVTVDENGLVTIVGAGNATLTVSLAESENYNAVAKTVSVTVLPKAVTVTPDSLTKVYDEADPELTYKADGLVGEDTLADITLTRAEGENTGTYDITAEAKEGSNPNYSITCEKGTFTITQKPIDNAEVTLGDALKYTGKEQTQNVAKVTLDGKEIPADAYTIENNTATEAGTYTLTIKAKEDGNYTGTLTWTYVVAPTQDSQIKENADGSVKIGDGTLKMQVKTEGGVPSASLATGKAQIIEMLIQSGDITADELALIAGGASVDIILTVKDGSATVSAEAKAQMGSGANGYTIGQYLDISLFKYMTINGVKQDGIQLRQTAGQITISVAIPEKLINTDSKVTRTYAVIRNHDGKADVLNTTYDAASQTLTFQTNLFSDYAIAYQDVKEAETETETESETETETETKQTETEKKSGTNGTSQTTAAKTGDTTNVAGYGMALLVSAMAVILLMRRKRTEK